MDRLLNISRPEGFPLCAETLGVLNNNSEMLTEWLKTIPLKNRQAVQFGNYLLVCQNLQRRLVKLGATSASSINQCKLVFTTTTHAVHDSAGNEISDVWVEEVADIVDETSPGAQWRLLGLKDVFETNLWYDYLSSFEAGLSGGLSAGGTGGLVPHGLDTITSIALYGEENEMLANGERARMKVAVRYQGRSTTQHVIQLPLPFECPDGVRMEADAEDTASGKHYPIEVYTDSGALMVCVGRWLRNEELIPEGSIWAVCDIVVRINKEVMQ